MIVPIASVESGARAHVSGVVRRARGELLTSSLTNTPCVYWDVRRGLMADPIRKESVSFWIEDASGRALVIAENLTVDARASRQQEVLRVADSDHLAVASRLREIKELLKTTAGPKAGALNRERTELAHVATLLLAIRAHARGRVHCGGSLAAQERWIRANADESGKDQASVKLMIDSWEVLIEEGQTVEVEGVCATEAIPPDAGVMGGYRDRPTCLVVRAPERGQLIVIGVGANAPVRSEPASQAAMTEKQRNRVRVTKERIPPRKPTFEQIVIAVLAAMLGVAVILTLLSKT